MYHAVENWDLYHQFEQFFTYLPDYLNALTVMFPVDSEDYLKQVVADSIDLQDAVESVLSEGKGKYIEDPIEMKHGAVKSVQNNEKGEYCH
jgi:hypothetical protein